MVFIGKDIPSKLLLIEDVTAEVLSFKIHPSKKKWFLNCSYDPGRKNISKYLAALRRSLDLYTRVHKKCYPCGRFLCRDN